YTVVDVTAPTITLTTPPEGAVYSQGQVVNADYSCADEAGGSGLATCVGDVPNNTASETSTVGAHTFTGDASANAGNNAVPVVHNYTVVAASTTPAITSDNPDPSVVGQSVTVKYSVTVNFPGSGTPTGNVTVSDGTQSCTGTVAAGQCTITFTSAGAK